MIGIYGESNIVRSLVQEKNIKFLKIDETTNLDLCDSLIIIGQNDETLSMIFRSNIESFIESGKPVYAEMVTSIGDILTVERKTNPMLRCFDVLSKEIVSLPNTLVREAFSEIYVEVDIRYSFTTEHAHRFANDVSRHTYEEAAMFIKNNIYYSCIPLFQASQFQMMPSHVVIGMLKDVFKFLNVSKVDFRFLKQSIGNHDNWLKSVIEWYKVNDLLIENGVGGMHEGLSAHISNEGQRQINKVKRVDCMMESAFLFYLAGDVEKYENLLQYVERYYIDDEGFVRWSDEAYTSMYPDDVARAFIPVIMKQMFYEEDKHERLLIIKITKYLETLVNDQGIYPTRLEKYHGEKCISQDYKISAHYNAYVCAFMMLSGVLNNKNEWINFGSRGLDSLLNEYPNTIREQSETQELARLLLPLAIRIWIRKNETDINTVKEIYHRLKKHETSLGLFEEWDTDYKAVMRFENGTGESSLLAKNGDSVSDLLYTNNWLPLSFAWLYHATHDKEYEKAFNNIKKALLSIQINSENPQINGVWMRGFDSSIMEYYGSPADLGWGSYCIETGWTVSVISYGILWGDMIIYDK